MTKYKLKKDTPIAKAGELFDIDPEGNLLTKDDGACFSIYSIQDLDDWFEKVEESVEWLHDGVSYYAPAVSGLARKFVPSYNEYRGDDVYDEARRRIGICYKSREACQRFIDFLTAVEAVSHDEGFMTKSEKGSGWAVCLKYDGDLGTEVIDDKLFNSFYFEWDDDAKASIEKHPDEWRIILNYKWSKGEDEEDED